MGQDAVKVAIGLDPELGLGSEGPWATPVDLPTGRYRIANVLFHATDVGLDDLVRCEVSGAGRLVVVEVLERGPWTTVVVGIHADLDHDAAEDLRREAFADLAATLPGRTLSGGVGLVAIAVEDDEVEAVLRSLAATADRLGHAPTRDDAEQVVGPFGWWVASHPDLPAPLPLAFADRVLAEPPPDLHVVDWDPASCPVASTWPSALVRSVRDAATISADRAAALAARCYLPFILIEARWEVRADHGADATGPAPFPVFPADFDEERWLAAHGPDGRVRHCPDDAADLAFRMAVERAGLDPDADPRVPSV